MLNKFFFGILIFSLGLLSTPAVQAHSLLLDQNLWLTGFIHPWQGLDHILAMIAIGLWAAQQGAQRLWQVPVAFVSILLVAAIVGLNGYQLAYVESGISSSLLIMGLMLAFAIRLSIFPSLLMVGLFALFHGYAHAIEMPQTSNMIVYANVYGFMFSSCILLGLGVVLGQLCRDQLKQTLLRFGGLAIGFTGVWLWI